MVALEKYDGALFIKVKEGERFFGCGFALRGGSEA